MWSQDGSLFPPHTGPQQQSRSVRPYTLETRPSAGPSPACPLVRTSSTLRGRHLPYRSHRSVAALPVRSVSREGVDDNGCPELQCRGGRGAVGSCDDCPLETPPTSSSSGRPSSPASWLAHASPPFGAAFGGSAPCVGCGMGWHHTQHRRPRDEQATGIAGEKEGEGGGRRVSAQWGKRLAGTNQEVTEHVAPCLVSGDRRPLIPLLHVPVRVVTNILSPAHIFLPPIRLVRSGLACLHFASVTVKRGRGHQVVGSRIDARALTKLNTPTVGMQYR